MAIMKELDLFLKEKHIDIVEFEMFPQRLKEELLDEFEEKMKREVYSGQTQNL